MNFRLAFVIPAALMLAVRLPGAQTMGGYSAAAFQSTDLYRLKSVGDVHLSPDGSRIAYSVQTSDGPGRPTSRVWIMDVSTGRALRLGSDKEGASDPRWSPDGAQIAYFGLGEAGASVMVSRPDGSNATLLAPVSGTNHPLPSDGERLHDYLAVEFGALPHEMWRQHANAQERRLMDEGHGVGAETPGGCHRAIDRMVRAALFAAESIPPGGVTDGS